METILSIDVGIIVAALAPTLTIIVTAYFARKDAGIKDEKLDGIHTLVNDAMTREKGLRLETLMAQRVVIERVLGEDKSDEDIRLLENMNKRIEMLREEIKHRDRVASHVPAFNYREE